MTAAERTAAGVSTPATRYEVGSPDSCAADHFAQLPDAITCAVRLAQKERVVTVMDRMARRGKPFLWGVGADGEVTVLRTRGAA